MAFLLRWDNMTQPERALASFVQGVLNRKGYSVFVDIDHYLDFLTEESKYISLWDLISLYKEEFDGAVCYDLNCEDVSINMAATICAAYDLLGVPRELIEKVNAMGIGTVCDLSDVKGSRAERQHIVFSAVKDKLSKTALIHQVVKPDNFHLMLRDFSICNRWPCIYTDQSDEDRSFRKEVLEFLDRNIPVYGWTDDEISFVQDVSTYGDYVIPMDWSSNHSYLGKHSFTIKQNVKREEIKENKHYVAIVVSDGDNIQWLERTFAYDSSFGQRQKSSMDYKVSWTFSPSLVKLSPTVAKKIYETDKSDYFISSVSGIGYSNMLAYPIEHLDEFTKQTSYWMKKSDLEVVCLLDDLRLMGTSDNLYNRLHHYARFDNIKGGIWELDPDHYRGGYGRIFVCDGKPFISVKYSFWHFSGDAANVTKDWIDNFACEINKLKVSPNTDDGYTVINVHPWTIEMWALDYLVSKLDDHIELVYADELIELYKNNVLRNERFD